MTIVPSFILFQQTLLYHLPVHNLPKRVKVIQTSILIVKIIGMFPHIKSKQRTKIFLHRVSRIGLLSDEEFAIGVSGEPHPAGAEERGAGLHELFLEVLEGAELRIDGGSQFAHRTVVGFRSSELQEIEVVVQNLSGIVEHPAGCFTHNLLQRHLLERGPGDSGIEIVDIPLQMFSVVESDGLGRDYWFQSISLIRQRN